MRIGQASGAAVLAMAAAGCAIVSPLWDRRMADAPRAACAEIGAAADAAERQCFALYEEGPRGVEAEWRRGGAIEAGRALVAIHRPGVAGCGGRFSHLTVEGSSPGAGAVQLSTWDPLGRPGHGRSVTWREGFAARGLALASIDHATTLPAGARVRAEAGRFVPTRLCFKGY